MPEWIDFQNTQKELVEQNTRMLGELGEIRNNIRQININLLGWQDAVQEAVAGKDVHCDAFKTKYDARVEYAVVALAVVGVFSIFNKAGTFFQKTPAKSK